MKCEKCNQEYKLKLRIVKGEKKFKVSCGCGDVRCFEPVQPQFNIDKIFKIEKNGKLTAQKMIKTETPSKKRN